MYVLKLCVNVMYEYYVCILCMYIILVLKLIILKFERHQYMNTTINIVSLKKPYKSRRKSTLKGKPKVKLSQRALCTL